MLGTAIADKAGDFTYTLTPNNLRLIGEGSGFELVASQADQLGNVGTSTPVSFYVDTVAPSAPSLIQFGGNDSVVTDSNDAIVTGIADPLSTVVLQISKDGLVYVDHAQTSASADGTFAYSLTVEEFDALHQGAGQYIRPNSVDSAGNTTTSYPLSFSVSTLPPTAPTLIGLDEVDEVRYIAVDSSDFTNGLTIRGRAPGSQSVEVNIGGKPLSSTAYVNRRGEWNITIQNSEIPSSSVLLTETLTVVGIDSYGRESSVASFDLRIDTSAPTVEDIINAANIVRIILSEQLSSAASIDTSNFRLTQSNASLDISSVDILTNLDGKSEIVLHLEDQATFTELTKLSFSGAEAFDSLGNNLSGFRNRVISHIITSNNIDDAVVVVDADGEPVLDESGEIQYESKLIAPHYSITTISINGSDPVDFQGGDSSESIFGNEADNRIAGGPGMDIITGLSGRDTFIYSSLSD